jgi:tRNA pseudouridine55 synthase
MEMHDTRPQHQHPEARQPEWQAPELADGILVVNKPADMTSAGVVNRIKRLPGVVKAGHTGTLDPFATGVLICPVNRATRLSRFFLHGSKKYAAVLTLGIETDTLDFTGEVTARHRVKEFTKARIQEVMDGYAGDIRQVPPVFSALKHNGVPL